MATVFREFYFDQMALESEIRSAIAMHSPVVASIVNVTDILASIIDVTLYGEVRADRLPPPLYLSELRVPSEVAEKVITHLYNVFALVFEENLGQLTEVINYTWKFHPCGDICVTAEISKPITPKVDPLTVLKKNVQEAVDNGDYIPESVRRLVGVL